MATMKPAAQTTFAELAGRTLGRLWRGCVRLERRGVHRLVAKGWAPGVAKVVMLLAKLAAIVVLVFAMFWSALVTLLILVIAAWSAHSLNDEDDSMSDTEWRYGPAGFGLYRGDVRIDIGDPNEDS